ncbi:MAG: cyclic nucleotide-binding domain-containing protein [Deltaproteobacteria bacterium]|nr:cyclic nucleotide-binding domain-containing protein [Deltaproteobacteria bacterium]
MPAPPSDLRGQDPAGRFGCAPEVWQAVLDWSRPLFYDQYEVIMAEGALAFNIYYVESGTVEVTYGSREKAIIVAFIGAGELFGEIGFFDLHSRVRTLRTTADSTIRTWDQDAMARMQKQDPALHGAFVLLLAKSICAKFRRILEEREPLVAYTAALSTGRRAFEEAQVLPPQAFQNPFWPQVNQLVETFKADFFDLSIHLQQAEDQTPEEPFQERCLVVLDRFNAQFEDLRRSIEGHELAGPFWGYIFKEIFPYFMRSRFAERAYYKPKGYAGDFQLMEMLYANTARGNGRLGALVDHWCLNTAAARAVRGRRALIARLLEQEAAAFAARRRPLRILNLACGSCRELFDFLAADADRTPVEALCVDADAEALEFTHQQVNVFPHQAVIRLMQADVLRWIIGREKHPIGTIDFIYSTGLADYLENPLFQTLARQSYAQLKPGGVLVVGNFGPANPNRAFMDHLLQWKLIHRSPEQLKALMAGTPFGAGVEVLAEPEGVNLFLIARKPTQD